MGLSLGSPSGVGLGLRARRWSACVDPVTDASNFPYRLSFDGGLARCTGAVSCGRQHLLFWVGGRHARVPRVCPCARTSWPGRAGRPLGRVFVRLTFPVAALSFCSPSPPPGCGCPLLVLLIAFPFFFFFLLALTLSRAFSSFRPRVSCALALPASPGPRSLSLCLFFLFLLVSPLSLAFSGFRPRVPWALALPAPPPPPLPDPLFFFSFFRFCFF